MKNTLRTSLSGTFLQTLPDLVTSLKGHSLSPRSCPPTRSAPSERFGYWYDRGSSLASKHPRKHETHPPQVKEKSSVSIQTHSSGAVWESRWTYWAVRPNEPSGFRGRKELLNRASALVTTCPCYVKWHQHQLVIISIQTIEVLFVLA